VIRLTSDCPLLDPILISQVVSLWRANPALEYVSTTLSRSFPRGLDVELASTAALEAVSQTARGYHRTHVTSALYEEGSSYERLGLSTEPNLSHLRVTLDTTEDAQALDELVRFLDQVPPSWQQVAEVLDANPHISRLNALVRQKQLNEG
jgi:spore coat polysaccharide biosynthesis protein SpsF